MALSRNLTGAVMSALIATHSYASQADNALGNDAFDNSTADISLKVRNILNTDLSTLNVFYQNGPYQYGSYDNVLRIGDDSHFLGDVYTASGSSGWGWVGLGGLALGAIGAGAYALSGGGGDDDKPAKPAQIRRTPDYAGIPASGPAPTPEDDQLALSFASTELTASHHNMAIKQHYALARGITGQGITIAITGNGVHNPDGVELSRSYLGQEDLFEKYTGEEDTTTSGTRLHETLVASVLVGDRNNIGTVGIAPDAKLIDFKISRNNYSGIIESQHVAKMVTQMMQSGARVFSQSWDYVLGKPEYFYDVEPYRVDGFRDVAAQLEKLHTIANGKGGVWVTAAGNRGDANPNFYMASMPHWFPALETQMITVVAIDGPFDPLTTNSADIVLAPYSSACGDAKNWCMAAPGDEIRAADADGTLKFFSGTSAAAPIVAGSVALIMSAFPEITGETAIKILFDTAVDLGAPGVDEIFGHGMPDLEKALRPVGGTTIQTADGAQSLQSSRLDVPASFGGAFDGAVTYTFEDSYQRHFTASLNGNDQQINLLNTMWRLPLLGTDFGFSMTAAGDGGAMAVLGNRNFFLSSLVEFNAFHGAEGQGAFAWQGTSITQSAHARLDLLPGLQLEADIGYARFDAHKSRFVTSVSAALVGARLTHRSKGLFAPTDSLSMSLGFEPTAINGTMKGVAPFRGEMQSYRHNFTTKPDIKFGATYKLTF
ncbi:MAG: S8 family peptidase [Alphaproteobacteria bacterium]